MAATQTSRIFLALGTINTIQVFGEHGTQAANAAMARVLQIHNRMSAFSECSDISRINASAGKAPVQIHSDTMHLLILAKHYARITKGAFDITLRPLSDLWNIGKHGDFIPSKDQIRQALSLTGIQNLSLNREDSTARLSLPGQSIDLGGIAKGYAGDEVRRILSEHGVRSALINLGGNIIAMGANPAGETWKIGVQNPLRKRGESLLSLSINNRSVVTSGMGERFFFKNGRFYHHILDPKTGTPAQNGLLSVTVIGSSGADADALATALFVLGSEKGVYLLGRNFKRIPEAERPQAIFIKEDLSVVTSPGLSLPPIRLTENK